MNIMNKRNINNEWILWLREMLLVSEHCEWEKYCEWENIMNEWTSPMREYY